MPAQASLPSPRMSENEKSAVAAVSNAGFVAWGLYGVLIVLGHPTAAVCVGLVVMLEPVMMREYRHGAVNIVDCTSLSFFVLALLTIVTTGHDLFSNYRIIAAWGIFAVVAWATLVAGFPFTLQYSRERAAREMWNATSFLTMNVIMTLVWAVIFTMDTILAPLALRGRHVLLLDVVTQLSPWFSVTPSIVSTPSISVSGSTWYPANVRSGNYVVKT
jgi:hypothetical protein